MSAIPSAYSNHRAANQGMAQFRVHHIDEAQEPVEVRATSRAVVECERRWPGLAIDGTDRYRPNEGVHFMVWVSLGKPDGDFEKWLDTVLSLEVLDEEPAPPTKRARKAN